MKITVESIGLPNLTAVIGKKTKIEFKGRTVSDLLEQLIECFCAKDRKMLLDGEGQLAMTIQVMVNTEGFLARDKFHKHVLKEGDHIRFVLLVDGG